MRFFAFLLFPLIITSCNNSGGVRVPNPEDPSVNNDFHLFMKEGSFNVVYYPNKLVTAGQKQIVHKLSKLMGNNSRTQEYFSQIQAGDRPAYQPNIGISKQEYTQLIELFSNGEPEKLNGTIRIIQDGNLIKFKGQGRLSLLDSVTININNKSASFKQYSMSLNKDSIDLSGEAIPKGDTIEFYHYYKGPDGILGLTALNGVYELLICKLKPSNKTYLSFFARQPDNTEHPIAEFITAIIDQ